MKKIMLLAVAVCALTGLGVASGVATAGNGAVTTHFTAAYFNVNGGNWTCQGEHIVGPASNPSVKENEECKIDNLATLPAGTYVGNPVFTSAPLTGLVWFSDFNGALAQSVSLKVTPGGEVVVRASY